MTNIEKYNDTLEEISRQVFGDSARLAVVDPKELVLLKENARFFKKDDFRQLVENIKQDGRLSGTPLCHEMENGRLEVLSGNHRVQASIEAKVEKILVIVVTRKLSKSEQISIQLSHNALVGQDDQQILANLWAKIDDMKSKIYAGLSSETLDAIEKIKPVTLTTPQIATKSVTFLFTQSEMDALDQIIDELGKIPADKIYMAAMQEFKVFFEAIQKTKKTDNIKNASLAMLALAETVKRTTEEKCPL
jgi:hypothetical protein